MGLFSHDTATLATTGTNSPEMAPLSPMSPLSQRRTAESKPQAQPVEGTPFQTPQPSRPAPSRPEPDAFPYGRSFDGRPLTWTGKVVSLDAWRELSDWERHGSTGKLWNGLTRQWEPMKSADA